MRKSLKSKKSNIEAVFDGAREGDVVAEIRTPRFKHGIRIYTSVKKSADTVGGQDVPGVIRSYKDSRSVKCNNEGYPFSDNCESWEPGFIFPFICGRPPVDIYKLAITRVGGYLPFYTIKHKKECAHLLKEEFIKMGLVDAHGKLDQTKFVKFITEK